MDWLLLVIGAAIVAAIAWFVVAVIDNTLGDDDEDVF